MKVNVTLDDELLQRADEYADRNYMSRSGLLSLALTSFLNSNEMMLAIMDLSVSIRKIADQGTVDDDTLQQLEDFERLSKLIALK